MRTYEQARVPFLRWAGSKRKMLPVLASVLPPDEFDRYVEPFCGSACLFFHLAPRRALLADINRELVNTYRQVKARHADVHEALRGIRGKSAEAFYRVRRQDPSDLTRVRRAARFIYLNRLCFNGLYRTNMKGEFNVPFGGGSKVGDFPTLGELQAASTSLRGARLMGAPFEEALDQVVPGDFVYLDPPYSISNRRVFNNYSNDIFGIENLKRLRKDLRRLDRLGVPFLLSYGLSSEALELSKGFRVRDASVQRQISGFAANRRRARELLISNY